MRNHFSKKYRTHLYVNTITQMFNSSLYFFVCILRETNYKLSYSTERNKTTHKLMYTGRWKCGT